MNIERPAFTNEQSCRNKRGCFYKQKVTYLFRMAVCVKACRALFPNQDEQRKLPNTNKGMMAKGSRVKIMTDQRKNRKPTKFKNKCVYFADFVKLF